MSKAEEHLRNPPPGSAAAAAREYGVDLTLLIERLRQTPDQRVRDLQSAMIFFEGVRAAGEKNRDRSSASASSPDGSGR